MLADCCTARRADRVPGMGEVARGAAGRGRSASGGLVAAPVAPIVLGR